MIKVKAYDQKTEKFCYLFGLTLKDMQKLLNYHSCEIEINNNLFFFVGGINKEDVKRNIKQLCQNGDMLETYMNEGKG